eukprot:663815-Hanusia_phi.AAC.2
MVLVKGFAGSCDETRHSAGCIAVSFSGSSLVAQRLMRPCLFESPRTSPVVPGYIRLKVTITDEHCDC